MSLEGITKKRLSLRGNNLENLPIVNEFHISLMQGTILEEIARSDKQRIRLSSEQIPDVLVAFQHYERNYQIVLKSLKSRRAYLFEQEKWHLCNVDFENDFARINELIGTGFRSDAVKDFWNKSSAIELFMRNPVHENTIVVHRNINEYIDSEILEAAKMQALKIHGEDYDSKNWKFVTGFETPENYRQNSYFDIWKREMSFDQLRKRISTPKKRGLKNLPLLVTDTSYQHAPCSFAYGLRVEAPRAWFDTSFGNPDIESGFNLFLNDLANAINRSGVLPKEYEAKPLLMEYDIRNSGIVVEADREIHLVYRITSFNPDSSRGSVNLLNEEFSLLSVHPIDFTNAYIESFKAVRR